MINTYQIQITVNGIPSFSIDPTGYTGFQNNLIPLENILTMLVGAQATVNTLLTIQAATSSTVATATPATAATSGS